MSRLLLIILLVTVSIFNSEGQQIKALVFEENTHDFGKIKEEDGPAEHEFRFKNDSGQPLVILRVKASCGCTTPAWTRDTIPMGDYGFIRAKYDTRNRPGEFRKSLTVYSSIKSGTPTTLFIKGEVIPRPKGIEEELPTLIGSMRTKYRVFNLGKISSNEAKHSTEFDWYNDGEDTLKIVNIEHPQYIEVLMNEDYLLPGSRGKLTLNYDALMRADIGFMNENITLYSNEKGMDSVKSYSVYANIVEYFPAMSSVEMASAPILALSKTMIELGTIKEGEKRALSVQIYNKGKEVLKIRKIEPNCSCLTVEVSSIEIEPGKSTEMNLTFDTSQRKGNQQKAVTIYSNSPKNPVSRVTLKSYVQAN